MTPLQRVMSMNKANDQKAWEITACVVAVDLAVTYLMRAATQIHDAVKACSDKTNCALSVMNIMSSFVWAAQFFAGIAGACPVESAAGSGCAAFVTDFVATVASWGPLMAAIPIDCDKKEIGKSAGDGERNGDI